MGRKLVSVDTCSTVCVPSIYFKSLLTNLSGDAAESPESALPVIQVLDVTGQITPASGVTGRHPWRTAMVKPGIIQPQPLETQYSHLEILDLAFRNLQTY